MVTRLLLRMQKYTHLKIRVGSKSLDALVADSTIKRMIGLMHRDGLGQGQCMLFVFQRAGMHGIWMRNMHFPLDVIWLDEGMRIVGIKERLRPAYGMEFSTYYPDSPARYVIELNAGFVKANSVTRRTNVRL